MEGWTACCHLEGSPQSALPRSSLTALPVGAACSPLSPHPPKPPALSPHPGGGAQPWLPAASPSSHQLLAGSYLSEASVVPLPCMRRSGTQAGTRDLPPSQVLCASRGPDSWAAPRSPNSSPCPFSRGSEARSGPLRGEGPDPNSWRQESNIHEPRNERGGIQETSRAY